MRTFYFSEFLWDYTCHSLDVLYRAHSGLFRDTTWLDVSPSPLPLLALQKCLKLIQWHSYGNMKIFSNYHLNLSNSQFITNSKLCVINQHLRKMLWGFKSKYDFLLRNMSSYEEIGTKSMFITHFGRHKWIGKEIIFQYSMKYYIIMKIVSIITPIITLIFSLHVALKTH